MEWFRWYSGTFNDPKLQWVANKTCNTVASVLAVWVTILERANNSDVRGCCEGLDFESLDVSLGLEDGAVHDIYQALIKKGMIVDNDMVANWDKRQPKREDDGAAERQRSKRDKDKLLSKISELESQLENALSRNVTAVTQCHAESQQVTTDKRRLEEKREELKPKVKTQQQHAGACEQLAEVVADRAEDLQRLFPDADIPVVVAKLLHHYRDKPCLLDPWATALKWFQREFKAVALLPVAARASPGGYAEQWRSNAAREAEAFIYGGTNDENNEQCGRAPALSGGNGWALQGAHAAAGS